MKIILVIVLAIFIFLFLIMPRLKRPKSKMFEQKYFAHRGLHDNETDRPENSIAAFAYAVENNYGIELDVQLSKDNKLLVFHDDDLKRVCGVDGKIADYTFEELREFRLLGTEEKIPLFTEVLEVINGEVPLIVELKPYDNPSKLANMTNDIMRNYKGLYCVESFNPFAIRWYKWNRPDIIRGQLSGNLNRSSDHKKISYFFCRSLIFNLFSRPDFISYDFIDRNDIPFRLDTHLFKATPVAWTIKNQKELDQSRNSFDIFIFEGFNPR